MFTFNQPLVQVVHGLLENKISKGNIAIDLTCGNGWDSLFLAERIGAEGKLFCFDIQEQSIHQTKNLLQQKGLLERAVFILDSHENLNLYPDLQGDVFMMNLGYLPGGNKNITTQKNSTIGCLHHAIHQLNEKGVIAVICYKGHQEGLKEFEALEGFLKELPSGYIPVKIDYLNRAENSPVLYWIEKK